MSKETVLKELNTDKSNGLSCDTVLDLQQKFGPNRLKEKKKKTSEFVVPIAPSACELT